MKARALIGSASYEPEQLKALYRAFDTAWEQIEPGVGDSPVAMQAARMKLAETVLSAAGGLEEFDANGLADIAVQRMHAQPTQLPRNDPPR